MTAPVMVILLAEDDEGHAELVQRNLRRVGLANEIVHARDGAEALERVRGEGPFRGRPLEGPVLAVVDINMPRLDGVELLKRLKASPETAVIPVIVLTTTDDPREIARCYELGCSVYITKPVDPARFIEAIRRLGLFLQVVQPPPETRGP